MAPVRHAAMPALQEVITAVKLKLHITVLVLNDNAYGVRCPRQLSVTAGIMIRHGPPPDTPFQLYWRRHSPHSHAPDGLGW